MAAGGLAVLFFLLTGSHPARPPPFRSAQGPGAASLAWFDRSGRRLEVLGSSADYLLPRLSPDGRRIAADLVDGRTHRRDIWLYDLERRAWARFTADPSSASLPIWSPDGRRIVFSSTRKGPSDLYEKAAGGLEAEELLFSSETAKDATDWSTDGRFIAFTSKERDSETGCDLWILTLAERKATPFLETRAEERGGVFSPDGASIAYSSNESGKDEVYVRPFPGPGDPRRISTDGGSFPRWRRDGKEIFYVAPGNRVMSAPAGAGSGKDTGSPRELFAPKMTFARFYDVSPDGQRFLISLSNQTE